MGEKVRTRRWRKIVGASDSIHRVTEALERLMEEDAAADRPFIAALAISKACGGLPGPGFFDCARRLGRFAGDPYGQDARTFHTAELKAVFACWGGSGDNWFKKYNVLD
jgi:hypothetical protein